MLAPPRIPLATHLHSFRPYDRVDLRPEPIDSTHSLSHTVYLNPPPPTPINRWPISWQSVLEVVFPSNTSRIPATAPTIMTLTLPRPPATAAVSFPPSRTDELSNLPRTKPRHRFHLATNNSDSESTDARPAPIASSSSASSSVLLTTPIPPARIIPPSKSVAPPHPPLSIAVASVVPAAQAVVASGMAASSGSGSGRPTTAPRSPPSPTSPRSFGANRATGLRLDFGAIKNTVPTTSKVRPSATSPPNKHIRSKSHHALPPVLLRKKSGELVKPSLKPSSSSMFVTPSSRRHEKSISVHIDTTGIGRSLGSRSEPTTPVGPKGVRFDDKLEHVKLFLAEQKPLAVSRDGSPTETSEGGEDFFSNQYTYRSSDDERIRQAMEIQVTNMPNPVLPVPVGVKAALEALGGPDAWDAGRHVRVESLILESNGRAIRGLVLVRNMAFAKWVAARFTLDGWQTTSEVTGRHVVSVPGLDGTPFQYDRFEFFIRLDDMLAKIWEKSLEIAVRFSCEGHGEMWDNNNGQNYRVNFRRKTNIPPRSAYVPDTDEEDETQAKMAALKQSLYDVIPTPQRTRRSHITTLAPPQSQDRESSPVRPLMSPTQQQQHSPSLSFINSRSAADVLSRVGRQPGGSPTGVPLNNGPFSPSLTTSPSMPAGFQQEGPLSPRKNREGTLTARYDFGSSLRNATLSPPLQSQHHVPFPRSVSPVRPPSTSGSPATPPVRSALPPSFNTFTSTNVTFNPMRHMGRSSPRDVTTPGREAAFQSSSPPFRTYSDSDLSASFVSTGAVTPPSHALHEYQLMAGHVPMHSNSLQDFGSSSGGGYFSSSQPAYGYRDEVYGGVPASPSKSPGSRHNSFPPLSTPPTSSMTLGAPWGSMMSFNTGSWTPSLSVGAISKASASPRFGGSDGSPLLRSSHLENTDESIESSTFSTPEITSRSGSSNSSPSSPAEVMPADDHPQSNNLNSFLDQYCFYTGPDGTPRRNSTPKSFSPSHESADQFGNTTPRLQKFSPQAELLFSGGMDSPASLGRVTPVLG